MFGTEEATEAYNRLLAEWHANGGSLRPQGGEVLVVNLCAAYMRHAQEYYRDHTGRHTTSYGNVRRVVRDLRRLFGSLPVEDFGPTKLRDLRHTWVQKGLARNTVNGYAQIVKLIFSFGVEHELVNANTHAALREVKGLKMNRTAARETKPVTAVSLADIEAVRPFVSRQGWGLIQVGLHTGARPGEYVGLRAMDLDMSGDIWKFRPEHHKNAYRGQKRVVLFGPKAQEAIRPFLLGRPTDKPLFSPREAEAERKAKGFPNMEGRKKASPRRDDQTWEAKTDRVIRDAYDTDSYRGAIQSACKAAKIERWAPNQLRHTTATMLREQFGVDTAITVLGQSIGSAVIAVYAEASEEKAVEAMLKVG